MKTEGTVTISIDDYIELYTTNKDYKTLVQILKDNGKVMTISVGDYLSISGIGVSNDIERKLHELYETLMAEAKSGDE